MCLSAALLIIVFVGKAPIPQRGVLPAVAMVAEKWQLLLPLLRDLRDGQRARCCRVGIGFAGSAPAASRESAVLGSIILGDSRSVR